MTRTRPFHRSQAQRISKRRHEWRLHVEAFESRLVLATFTVTNLNDAVVTVPGQAPGTLRQAIFDANTASGGDIITFQAGLQGTIALTAGALTITDSVSVEGPGAAVISIDGQARSRVLNVDDNISANDLQVSLSGLTLSGGSAADGGGGIRNRERLSIADCRIARNSARFGGGIYSTARELDISSCTISDNSSTFSGGGLSIYVLPHGEAVITDTTVSHNVAGTKGGGIESELAPNYYASTLILSSTISGNSANTSGGGVYCSDAYTIIHNSTITDNYAPSGYGSGVASGGASSGYSTSVVSTIISGNANTDVDYLFFPSGTFVSGGYNMIGDGNATNLFNQVTDQSGIIDPKLSYLAPHGGPTETHMPRADSPAIDMGTNLLGLLQYDQRGGPFQRGDGSGVDVGAVERQMVTGQPFPLVVDTVVDENDGDYGLGDMSLREAIGLANGSVGQDVVGFDVLGVFADPQTIGLQLGELIINASALIEGPGVDRLAIDGQGQSRVFHVDDGLSNHEMDVSMSGLTITGGYALGDAGGGILSREHMTLSACQVRGNSSDVDGGGIFNVGGNLSVLSCAFTANHSDTLAGAIGVFIGDLTIMGSRITANVSGNSGGGIWHSSGEFILSDSTVSGNWSPSDGGGVYHANGDLTITNSTISGNAAQFGGGINLLLAPPGGAQLTRIANTSISGNTASIAGGGLYNEQGSVLIQNSTISANEAPYGYGGGVGSRGGPAYSRVEVVSSIIAGNLGTDVDNPFSQPNSFVSNGHNVIGFGNASGYFRNTGDQWDILDPGLAPLAPNGGPTPTHALLAGSPALHNGANPLGLTSDQRGAPFSRNNGGGVDAGAFERQTAVVSPLVVDTAADDSNGDYGKGDLSLREAIGLSNGSLGLDVISFDTEGVFANPQIIALALGELQITDSTIIEGPGADQVVIDAQGLSRMLTVYDGDDTALSDVSINGLTMTGGRTTEDGDTGGGVRNFEDLTLVASTVSNNITSGEFAHGGGIYNSGELRILRCAITGNAAAAPTALGGGIFTDTELYNTQTTVINSTISNNGSGNAGGGIFNFDGPTVIRLSTITNNDAAPGYGSGVASFGDNYTITEVSSSIIAGNQTTDVDAVFGPVNSFQTAGYNLIGIGNAEGIFVGPGDQRGITNPGLAPLAHNGGRLLTHALLPGSPARNAGDPNFLPPPHFDQRAAPFARVSGLRMDIGSYEFIDGDFNGDHVYNCADVDDLVANIAAGLYDPTLDLNSDMVLDTQDLDTWLAVAGAVTLPSHRPYLMGDASLDGVVDGVDFNIWNSNKFTFTAAWCAADFNADGAVDGSDFNIWSSNKFQSSLTGLYNVPLFNELSTFIDRARGGRADASETHPDSKSERGLSTVVPNAAWRTARYVDAVWAKMGTEQDLRRDWWSGNKMLDHLLDAEWAKGLVEIDLYGSSTGRY